MNKETKKWLIIISVFALLNVMFMPIFDAFGGFLPDDARVNFFDVIDMIREDSDAWDLWVVQFTMCIFIPSVLMLIMALVESKQGFMLSCAAGMLWCTGEIIAYIDQYAEIYEDFGDIFELIGDHICIGTWIGFAIFAVSLSIPNYIQESVVEEIILCERNASEDTTQTYEERVCPNCGASVPREFEFCGKCGNALTDNLS